MINLSKHVTCYNTENKCKIKGWITKVVTYFFPPQIIQKPSHDLKQQLAGYSKRVAGSVTELIQAAEAMKGILTIDLFEKRMTAEQNSSLQWVSVYIEWCHCSYLLQLNCCRHFYIS